MDEKTLEVKKILNSPQTSIGSRSVRAKIGTDGTPITSPADNIVEKEVQEKMVIRLKCPREECGYEWDYDGKSEWYTSCPRCKTSVSVRKPSNKDNGKQ